MYGFTNFTNPVQYEPRFPLLSMVLICFLLGFIILWTIVGNVLVLVTIVTELKINNSSNHLIFSLAITDLLVAVTVMPLSVINKVSNKWWLGLLLCDVWIFVDVLACTASIFHLVVIAIDRYLSITKLSYNRNRSLRSTSFMIASAWIAAIIVSVPSRFHFLRQNKLEAQIVEINGTCIINQGNSYTILANCLSFGVPLLVIVFIYIKIFFFIIKQTKNRRAIKNSAIGSDALTMALTNDFSFAPNQPIWNGNHLAIAQDQNSFETGYTESLEQSTWIDEILPMLPYADEDIEYIQKSNFPSPDDSSNKFFNSFDKSSSNSFQTSAFYSNGRCTPSTDFPINIAEEERITSDEDEDLLTTEAIGKCNIKTLTSNKSIIKSPTSNFIKLRSPTLSWSPKLTFYAYRRANQNHHISGSEIHDNSESLSNQEKSPMSIISAAKCHVMSGDSYSSSFQSVAIKTKRFNQKREFRVARTLFILTGLFIICWMPFAINNVLRAYVYKTNNDVNDVIDSVFLWLGYINSGLNPIIYTIFSPDFQAAFKKIICGNNVDI